MKTRILALAGVTALSFSACSTTTPVDDSSASPTAVGSGATKVYVAFYPLEYAATQAGGDLVSVTNLTVPGQEPHDLELTPQQIAGLDEANLVVYLSGFQPAVDEAVTQSSVEHKLDLAEVLELRPGSGEDEHEATDSASTEARETTSEEAHADDHDHETTESAGADTSGMASQGAISEDDHDHGSTDPHFWLDPTLEAQVIDAVAAELAEIDAANAAAYQANAEAADEALTALDEEFKTGLANCTIKTIITSHTAFSYLTERYGLEQVGISGLSPNEQPSPTRIAEVQDLATEHGVTTIFFETLTSDAVASSIAGDLGLKTAVLDPIEGITDQSAGTDYPSLMKTNLETLKIANGCS